MLNLQHISYIHPDKETLFSDIGLAVSRHQKIALVGNNGSGKSTLLKIMARELRPSGGQVSADAPPYLVPQVFGQFNHLTVAEALGVDKKLKALSHILEGRAGEEQFGLLNDDWTIEERCREALSHWQLDGLDLAQTMATLSGGQKTKVFLAGIAIHQARLVLLDEPSNHLDLGGRQLLYRFIRTAGSTLVIVSHDRKLLNLTNTVCELSKGGIKVYGGSYDFYREQKQLESNALTQDIHSREKELRKAREKEREMLERRQRAEQRGKGMQEKAGQARIMMNTWRNAAENSSSKLRSVHSQKTAGISQELHELRSAAAGTDQMKVDFDHSELHSGKLLFSASGINLSYGGRPLWHENRSIEIRSGERIALKGSNGSGKTTLLRVITGALEPHMGTVYRAGGRQVYIDQEYSLLEPGLSIYAQAQRFNTQALQEHELKTRLSRFLFTKEDWDKPCSALSGGERMRLALCCLGIGSQAPDIIILDEPTNNLDIRNCDILTAAVNQYRGTLIVVSHDETFLEQISIGRIVSIQ